jgi:Icc-related predicted phosphoesterase
MRIVSISDTHNRHKHLTSKGMGNILPDGDLLIHAGDLTGQGARSEVENVIEWMIKQAPRYTHGIVFIAGNHDRSFDPKFGEHAADDEMEEKPKQKPVWLRHILSDLELSDYGVHYLENSSMTINNINIWGSPYSPWFHGDRWAFNSHRGPEIETIWAQIPFGTNIVVTHTPISYKLDYVPRNNEYTGCEQLRNKIQQIKPLLHFSGHIHESRGFDYDAYTYYFNSCICNLNYEPNNKPFEIDVDWDNEEVKIVN